MATHRTKNTKETEPPYTNTSHITKHGKCAFVAEESISKEVYGLFTSSLQISLCMIFEVCVYTVSTIFIARLENSTQILSAIMISGSFVNMTAIVMAWGFTSALWTLIPQAVGSRQSHLVTLYVQRAFVISIVMEIPFSIMLLYTKQILSFSGINSDGAIDWDIITKNSIACIPYPYLMFSLSILHRIAQNFNYNFEILIVHSITFFGSIPLNYLFITVLGMDIGSRIVYNLTLFFSIVLMVCLLVHKGHSYMFKPLSFRQICDKHGLYQYLALGFPGCVKLTLTWAVRAFPLMLSGSVTNADIVVACTGAMKSMNAPMLIHNGLSNAFTIRTGQYIGANQISYAKRCIKIQICFALVLMTIIAGTTAIFGSQIMGMYTSNVQIMGIIGKVFYVIFVDQICIALHRNVGGVFRALGYQKITVYSIILSQFFVALPLQTHLLFGYKYSENMEMSVAIIWLSESLGYFLGAIILICTLVFYVSWDDVIQESESRIQLNNKKFEDGGFNYAKLGNREK